MLQDQTIVIRTTAVGALCLGGAVGSCVGFGHSGGAWVPYAIVAVGTLIMWMLGRTLRDRLVEGQRISEV